MRPRPVAVARLVVLVAVEVAAVGLLRGQPHAGAVDWRHLRRWLATAAPDDAVVAVAHAVAVALAVWLLASTALYLVARLANLPALVRGTAWATLPAVRHLVDAAVVASLVGGAVGLQPAGAQVPGPPPVVIELSTTTTAPGHLYVPVPAGDDVAPSPTAVAAPPPTRAPAAPASKSTPAPPPARPPELAAHTYTVVAGDNLWTIAEGELSRQTGRTPDHLAEVEIRNYWISVIDANRGRLRSGDPNLIYPGESIVCPPAA